MRHASSAPRGRGAARAKRPRGRGVRGYACREQHQYRERASFERPHRSHLMARASCAPPFARPSVSEKGGVRWQTLPGAGGKVRLQDRVPSVFGRGSRDSSDLDFSSSFIKPNSSVPRVTRRICRATHISRRRRVPAGTPARVHLRTGATPVAMTRLRYTACPYPSSTHTGALLGRVPRRI